MSYVLPKRLAGVIASVVAFAIIAPSTLLSVKADNNNKVQLGSFEYASADNLGGANAFAVFAKNYNDTSSDMEGLIAADNVTFGNKDIGASGNVSQYIIEGYNLNYFGSSISGTFTNIRSADALILPDDVTIVTNDPSVNNGNGVRLSYGGVTKDFNQVTDILNSSDASKITNVKNSTFTIDFDQAFNALKSYSSTAYNQADTVQLTIDASTISIVCQPGLNYVNIDASELSEKTISIVGNGTTDYSLVINVKNAGDSVTFNHSMLIDGQGYDGYGPNGGKILWNLGPDYSGSVTFIQDAMGVVLAPSGTVHIGQSHNGSVFAAYVSNDGCEIHQNPFQGSPVNPNKFTVTPTEAPVEPTEVPVEPTETPVQPTEAPVEPTEAPVQPTEAPVVPTATAAPVQPTQTPAVTTSAPVVTTTPVATTAPVTPVTTTLTISKQDMTGTTGAELDGAKMILTAVSNSSLRYLKVSGGKVGAPVTQTAKTISWTSGNTPFVIEDLPDGTYTLEETVAPDGYDVITTTQFTISGGNISKTTSNTDVKVENNASGCYVTAFDEALTQPSTTTTNTVGVEISKQDIAGNEIADATLTITSLDGKDLSNVYVTQNGATVNVVLSSDLKSISFQTQELTNSIVFGLEAGKYELKETVTPVAYLRAESIVFEISDNGNVINTATNVQGSPIVMVDEADPTYSTSGTTTSVAFSKQSMTNLGTELVGATMKITTTNLSIDLSGVSYTGGDSVIRTTSMITWNTSDTVFEVDLPDGTYTLEEVVAPDGYAVITTTTFTVSGGVVTKTSSNTDVEIIGTYVTAFDEAYTGPSTLVAGASRVPPTTVENLNEAVEKASVVGMSSRQIPATGDSMAMTDIAAIVLLVAAAATMGTVAVKTKKEAR